MSLLVPCSWRWVGVGSDEEFFFPLVSVAAVEEGFSGFSLLVQAAGLMGQIGA